MVSGCGLYGDWGGWLNRNPKELGQRPALPRSVEGTESPLTSSASPYGQLLDVVSVIHSRRAVDLDLNLSILLKGSRGCGKQTTVSWIAQRMGMQLMEVSSAFFPAMVDNDGWRQNVDMMYSSRSIVMISSATTTRRRRGRCGPGSRKRRSARPVFCC